MSESSLPIDRPRLIERAFPLKQASLDSVHEKNVRHGHISTLHIWPARRPLAACRAALIATLLPDPGTPEERRKLCEKIAGKVVQKSTLRVSPSEAAAAGRSQEYSGDPIDLSFTNANLREVLTTFGQISGMQVRIDDAVQGKVSMSWHNVPWDEALDSIVRENGLTYRIEGSTLIVSKQ